MTERSVQLPEAIDQFVTESVRQGDYSNANEVIIEALRKLEEEHMAKTLALRQALDEGLASGVYEGDAFESVARELGWKGI